jgi:hypothetical protein
MSEWAQQIIEKVNRVNEMAKNHDWLANMTYEQLAEVKKSVIERMDAEKDNIKKQLSSELKAKLDLYGLDASDIGLGSKQKKETKKREIDPNKPCSICDCVTNPPHDARSHRSQEPKKAFTKAELEERGMVKVQH